jgi:hypothetical protein
MMLKSHSVWACLRLRVRQSPRKSYFVLECELPPDFGIVQYVVRED